MSKSKLRLRAEVQELVGSDIGCLDRNCVYGHPGGMATNGGCQCLKQAGPDELRLIAHRLSTVAKLLACEVIRLEEDTNG